MDKYEYRVKTEQMLEYAEQKQYKKAMEIADTIDWRRVKSITMLSSVSEIYEYNGEYKKSRQTLVIAFERQPGSRKLVYRLATLALKDHDIEEASDYYEEFVKIAPKDPNQYILKYKILKEQKASLDDQISALEDFKKSEYIEKWAYELAKLYHEAGRTAECLEECDDLILWFSEGKYVYQAMELKMKYKPLTPLQQEKYDSRPGAKARKAAEERAKALAKSKEEAAAAAKRAVEVAAAKVAKLAEETEKAQKEAKAAEEAEKAQKEAKAAVEAENAQEETKTAEEAEKTEESKKTDSPEAIEKVGDENKEEKAKEVEAVPANNATLQEKAMEDDALRATGQMRIDEILRAWEEKQKANADVIAVKRKEDEARIAAEREAAEKKREEDRKEVERLAAEAEAAQKAAEEEAARIAAEEAAKKAEEEAARKAAEEEAARKAAEEAARIAAEEAAKKAAEEAAQKAAEEEAARKAAEEAAQKAAEEEAAAKILDERTRRIPDDIVRLMAELETDVVEEETGNTKDVEINTGMIREVVGSVAEDLVEEDLAEEEFAEEEFAEENLEEEDFDEEDLVDEDLASEDFAEEMVDELIMSDSPNGDSAVIPEEVFEELEAQDPEQVEVQAEAQNLAEEAVSEEEIVPTESPVYAAPEQSFEEENFEEENFEEESFEEESFEEESFEEESFEEEELDEEAFAEEELPEEEFEEDVLEDPAALAEKDIDKALEALSIAEPTEEEIQRRIKKSKGIPFDTGFVVTGRYDLSATSEIGLKAGLTEDQKQLFSYFVPVRGMSEQLVEVLDNDRRAQREGTSNTGNLLVIGRKGSGKTVLAVDVVKAIQKQRNLKQGKLAIVTGDSLNKKDMAGIVQKLRGGAIIIEKAGKLNSKTINDMNRLMERKTGELLFVLEDQKKPLERMLTAHPDFRRKFSSRLELPVFINDELVTFGQTYAKENGYRMDEMGILALYSRIDVLQREDHAVSVAEVKDIMDAAIAHSQKANVKNLARRMFGGRADGSSRIALKEEDFRV